MDDIVLGLSSLEHGSMSAAVDDATKERNRAEFLSKYDISLDQTMLVSLRYEGDDYTRYRTVDRSLAGAGMTGSSDMVVDGLFTSSEHLALFLPIADCIGAVFYDPITRSIGLSHLGRHNLLQQGGSKTVEYMANEFNSDPTDLMVWLSPAAGPTNYPLYDFNGRGMHDVALMQLLAAGVRRKNVHVDRRDTTTEPNFFSHSEYLKGNRTVDGRQAVVAMMRFE